MPVLKNEDLPLEQMYPLVQRRELIGGKMGAQNITMGEIIIQPGGQIPLHKHSIEDCVLLREGSGEIHINDEVIKVQAPMTVLIPPNIKHRVVNTGDKPIRIIFGFPSINVDRQLLD